MNKTSIDIIYNLPEFYKYLGMNLSQNLHLKVFYHDKVGKERIREEGPGIDMKSGWDLPQTGTTVSLGHRLHDPRIYFLKFYLVKCMLLYEKKKNNEMNILTSGMNLMKLSKKVLKSFVERPIIALQTRTCTTMSKCLNSVRGSSEGDKTRSPYSGTNMVLLHCNTLRTTSARAGSRV